jgi:hypothetical protein
VLTLFTIPKPFDGPAGDAQRNALASWKALGDDVEIVLLGDEAGVSAAAEEAGSVHVVDIARGEAGTPRLDDAFARVDELARHPLRCFLNADVVLLDDFLPTVRRVNAWQPAALMVGQTVDAALDAGSTSRPDWRGVVRARALAEGIRRGQGAVDYFVFSPELYRDIPPFVVGRAGFDNWLIWHARSRGVPVVDATADVVAVHQSHDYGHLPGGKHDAYLGPEALRNLELAGGRRRLYSIADASHRIRGGRIGRNPWATLRAGDFLRRARWKLGFDRTP